MPDDSATRVEIGLRGALIAKSALGLTGIDPRFARLQMVEVARQLRELDVFLEKKGI